MGTGAGGAGNTRCWPPKRRRRLSTSEGSPRREAEDEGGKNTVYTPQVSFFFSFFAFSLLPVLLLLCLCSFCQFSVSSFLLRHHFAVCAVVVLVVSTFLEAAFLSPVSFAYFKHERPTTTTVITTTPAAQYSCCSWEKQKSLPLRQRKTRKVCRRRMLWAVPPSDTGTARTSKYCSLILSFSLSISLAPSCSVSDILLSLSLLLPIRCKNSGRYCENKLNLQLKPFWKARKGRNIIKIIHIKKDVILTLIII